MLQPARRHAASTRLTATCLSPIHNYHGHARKHGHPKLRCSCLAGVSTLQPPQHGKRIRNLSGHSNVVRTCMSLKHHNAAVLRELGIHAVALACQLSLIASWSPYLHSQSVCMTQTLALSSESDAMQQSPFRGACAWRSEQYCCNSMTTNMMHQYDEP